VMYVLSTVIVLGFQSFLIASLKSVIVFVRCSHIINLSVFSYCFHVLWGHGIPIWYPDWSFSLFLLLHLMKMYRTPINLAMSVVMAFSLFLLLLTHHDISPLLALIP